MMSVSNYIFGLSNIINEKKNNNTNKQNFKIRVLDIF